MLHCALALICSYEFSRLAQRKTEQPSVTLNRNSDSSPNLRHPLPVALLHMCRTVQFELKGSLE